MMHKINNKIALYTVNIINLTIDNEDMYDIYIKEPSFIRRTQLLSNILGQKESDKYVYEDAIYKILSHEDDIRVFLLLIEHKVVDNNINIKRDLAKILYKLILDSEEFTPNMFI